MKNICIIEDNPQLLSVFVQRLMYHFVDKKESTKIHFIALHSDEDYSEKKAIEGLDEIKKCLKEEQEIILRKDQIDIFEFVEFCPHTVSLTQSNEGDMNALVSAIKNKLNDTAENRKILLDMMLDNEEHSCNVEK